jgi:hypothetical protein
MLHRIAVEVRRSHPSMSQIKFVQLVAKEFQRRYPNNPLAQKHWRTIERTWRPDIWQMTHWTALEMAAAIEFMGDRKHKFAGHSLKQGHGLGRAFHLQNGLSEMNDAADLEGMVRKASEAADGRIICQGFLGRDRIRARRRSQR